MNNTTLEDVVDYLRLIRITLITCLITMAGAQASPANPPIFDVPRIENIQVDGDPSDWADKGFRVDVMIGKDGSLRSATDFDPSFRLAWNDSGLLLLATVKDDVVAEPASADGVSRADGIEFFLSTDSGGHKQFYQTGLTSGTSPKRAQAGMFFWDFRPNKGTLPKLTGKAAGRKTPDGYIIEALFPWENLGVKPAIGEDFGVQAWVYDTDPGTSRTDWYRSAWYPMGNAYNEPSAMHHIRLVDSVPSPAEELVFSRDYSSYTRERVRVFASSRLAGQTVTLKDGRKSIASRKLELLDGRAKAEFILPMPQTGQSQKFSVWMGKKCAQFSEFTGNDGDDPETYRAKALLGAGFGFSPCVFDTNAFPTCDFDNPQLAEDVIGPYSIKTTFYDKDYNVVASAAKPGRYGAVVDIIPESGAPFRRFKTLYKTDQPMDWKAGVSITLPKSLAIDPQVEREWSDEINYIYNSALKDWFGKDGGTSNPAVMLAALKEAKPGLEMLDDWKITSGILANNRWWLGLKRKLYANEAKYPSPFICPKPIAGAPAMTIHQGTLAEAGMKPDAAERIDKLCRQWAADSDEGFAVCVVRHGVVVLHKAYGTRDGKPMTVDTRSGMASITKLMSSSLMMMLVDQGLVTLDDRVDKYLPPFRAKNMKTPLTIRHLYTHTNGGWDHRGDFDVDFEELFGTYSPHLQVGVKHQYNGNGYVIGGDIIEQISGEALYDFYRNHLLGPLGCTNTMVHGTCWDSRSTPMDIAKIGQMLLNKGAYGDKRFFSESTFNQMLPVKLTKVLGPDTPIEWGIGMTYFNDEGLGKGTFGHGAASSATLRIDPENDLVVVMTRESAGKNFGEYHPQFLKTVADSIAR